MTRTKIAALFAVASIAVTGGSAFTAAITDNAGAAAVHIGTLTSAVTGGTVENVEFTLNAAGDKITGIVLAFSDTDFDDEHVYATPTGTGSGKVDCDRGVATTDIDPNTVGNQAGTTFTCGYNGTTTYGGNSGVSTLPGLDWDVATLTAIAYRVAPGQ
jgi:hypothetical protein